jgi:hypothetical protein
MSLVSVKQEIYLSEEAVWSKKFGGVYFPRGYRSNVREHGKAFFAINKDGEFSKVRIPKIEYSDVFEEKIEKPLYRSISKQMPAYLRGMFQSGFNGNHRIKAGGHDGQ